MAELEWLWKFKGQLKVIATPFRHGKHYATHPKHFEPIVNYLEEMHDNGYVHGDIRAYNLVLNYNNRDDSIKPQGYLIDFDFGGHFEKESPKYPSGYVQDFADCSRIGEPGNPIIFEYDWYALAQVIFKCYSLRNDKISCDIELGHLVRLQNDFNDFKFDGLLYHKDLATFLHEYLRFANDNGFEFRLVHGFDRSLKGTQRF